MPTPPFDPRQQTRARLAAKRVKAVPVAGTDSATIDRINELARTARTLWYGLLSYLAFVGVTVLGVKDADFFITERQTQLPLVNVSIPTNLFFIFAPILGAAFYTYLHHHLMKLWVALADQPEPQTGPSLSDLLLPWIVIDLVLDLRPGPPRNPQPLRRMAVAATILLVFAATPAILTGFWWRSMPAHDGWMTVGACGVALLLTLFVSVQSGFKLWDCTRSPVKLRKWLWASPANAGWLLLLALLTTFGWFKTAGDFDSFSTHFALQKADPSEAWWHQDTAFGALLNFPAEADLQNVVFVEKPADWRDFQTARTAYRDGWCKTQNLEREVCGPVPSLIAKIPDNEPYQPDRRLDWCRETYGPYSVPNPEPTDLAKTCTAHFAKRDDQFRADWETERTSARASLPKRDLSRRDLRRANLSGAQMAGANLSFAQMAGADLRFAQMAGADLRFAQMAGADLRGAQMEGAVLWRAQMEGAVLRGAQMAGADFSYAQLEGADFSYAQMEGADLRGAQMEGQTSATPI